MNLKGTALLKTLMVTFVALVLLVSCSTAQQDDEALSPGQHFAFYVDPWISLHHFSYHLARENAVGVMLRGRVPITPEDRAAMSPAFVEALNQIYAAYEPYLDTHLLFDDATRRIGEQLIDGPEAVEDVAVREALINLMPHYLDTAWPRHKAASESLRDRLMGQLDIYEGALSQRLADYLESRWPDEPIRVDVVAYANRQGAYTFDPPPRITLGAYDEDTGGALALEILFHESTHTALLGQNLAPAAERALVAAGIENDRFWHYALFFISGQITTEVLGDPNYQMYAVATGLSARESAAPFYDAFAANWSTSDGLGDFLTQSAMDAAATLTASEEH